MSEWATWIADNLARGCRKSDVVHSLEENGFPRADAERAVQEILESPLFQLISRQRGQLDRWSNLMRDLEALESSPKDCRRVPAKSVREDFEFVENFVSRNRPVIIDDWVSSWSMSAEWTLDGFVDQFGSVRVRYQDRTGLTSHLDSFTDNSVESTFGSFAGLISKGTSNVYMIAHDRALERVAFRSVIDRIPPCPMLLNEAHREGRVFLWIGSRAAVTHMHRDLNNGIVAQVAGRRRFKLIPSRQMDLVYNTSGFHSDVDFLSADLSGFPDLKRATVIDGTLQPGQALFLPLGWWHFFEALEPTISLTFANVRRASDN